MSNKLVLKYYKIDFSLVFLKQRQLFSFMFNIYNNGYTRVTHTLNCSIIYAHHGTNNFIFSSRKTTQYLREHKTLLCNNPNQFN